MKIEGKEHEKEVVIPKVWEHIVINDSGDKETFLISKPVSDYIRSLEFKVLLLETSINKNTQPF